VNDDVAIGVRHSVTSCTWPCNGAYFANYPGPDGVFDSGRLGNADYIDGGLVQENGGPLFSYGPSRELSPVWSTPTDLAPGTYVYFCRIHPRMRGAFEVV
jgi:hypothetical protein